MAAEATWFTFPDGELAYDCAACGQACCRGHGFAAGAELIPLLRHAPALGAHVTLRPGGAFGMANLTQGCWYLGSDGWCTVEKSGGRALKPATCRLFPFNRVYLLGAVRIVDVNSMLCPVERRPGAGIRHAEITDELAAFAGSPLIDVATPPPPGLPADWLDHERAAVAAAAEHASAVQAGTGDADTLAATWGDPDSAARARRWGALHGFDDAARIAAERLVFPSVATLTGSLRWNTLFARGAAPYPDTAALMPRQLRALTFLGALATRTSGGSTPSLRSLTELWRQQAQLLTTLARWDDRVVLRSPRFDADVPELLRGPLTVMLSLAFRGGKSVGELIEQVAASMAPPERPLAVALAASQLDTLLGAA